MDKNTLRLLPAPELEVRINTLQQLLNELTRYKFKYANDVIAVIAERLHETHEAAQPATQNSLGGYITGTGLIPEDDKED